MTVSDLLLSILNAYGVRHLFGMPGDAINDVMDAVRRQNKIDFVQVRHEEAGAFAASAQAKLTGRLAACVGTAGPGAIHLLNGLYDAKLDHAPVIAITGQVSTNFIGTAYHQEVRLERLFADVAVYSQTVVTEDQLPAVFLEACHAALAHRGVAHISLPTDVSGRTVSIDPQELSTFSLPGEVAPAVADCSSAIDKIDSAERIAILGGIGCRDAGRELRAFADRVAAPIIRSLRAKEVIDDDDPLCIGGLGLLGGSPAVRAMDECDLLIMVGTDFPYREFYPRAAEVIQIDVSPTQIGKRHPVDVALTGHAAPTLARLTRHCQEREDREFLEQMQTRMQKWLAEQSELETSDARPIRSPRVLRELTEVAPPDSIFVADTGTATAWTARHLRLREGQRYTLSGGLASMAYALPGAIGAQLAFPGRRVFGIAGDGGFEMLMGDFVTAVRYELPIVMLVLNNSKLAFITLEQQAKGLPDYGTELTNPNFADIAVACGGRGFRVEEPSALRATLEEAIACGRPSVVDVVVDPDQLIMPPRIELKQALNFGLSKIREAFSLG